MTAMTAPERRYYVYLGQRLRAARKQAGLRQLDLAVQLVPEVSHVAISYWERAAIRPSAWYLTQLDRIFGDGWRQ